MTLTCGCVLDAQNQLLTPCEYHGQLAVAVKADTPTPPARHDHQRGAPLTPDCDGWCRCCHEGWLKRQKDEEPTTNTSPARVLTPEEWPTDEVLRLNLAAYEAEVARCRGDGFYPHDAEQPTRCPTCGPSAWQALLIRRSLALRLALSTETRRREQAEEARDAAIAAYRESCGRPSQALMDAAVEEQVKAREQAEAARDEAIKALAEEGRKRGQAEAERDDWKQSFEASNEHVGSLQREVERLREGPHYSGEDSIEWWAMVKASDNDLLYIAACALQDHESRVRQMLALKESPDA